MDYSEYIHQLKEEWLNRKVIFEGKEYTVVGIDYNGALLIDRVTPFTQTTAVNVRTVKYQV